MYIEFTFFTIVTAIIKLFILMLAGYLLYNLKFINDEFTDKLSLILVRVIFPALIVSKITTYFSFAEFAYWWVLPLCAVIFSITGALLGYGTYGILKGFKSKKEFVMSCAFQNCGYLPMNLILFSFAGAVADRLLIYLFLFILGFNILMWSFVPLFLSGSIRRNFKISILLNPPVIATVFSLIWVTFMGKGSVPGIIADPLRLLGQAAFPIAMMTLGAYMCRYHAYRPENKLPVIVCAVTKLILFPALVLAGLILLPISPDYKFFLFLQGIMPTAISLVVIGSYTNADNKFFSSSVFYTHLIAIFSIPLWLSVFRFVMK